MITGCELYFGYYTHFDDLIENLKKLNIPDINFDSFDKYDFNDNPDLFWKALNISKDVVEEKKLCFSFEKCCRGNNFVFGIKLMKCDFEDDDVFITKPFDTNNLPTLDLPFGTSNLICIPNDCNRCT